MKAKKQNTKAVASHVPLPGSQKAAPMASAIDTLNPNEVMTVTIRVRRKKSIESVLKSGKHISHEDYEKNYGAAAADLAAVEDFAGVYQLRGGGGSEAKKNSTEK